MAPAIRFLLIGAGVGVIFPLTALIIRYFGEQPLFDPLVVLFAAVPLVTATWAYLSGLRSEQARRDVNAQLRDFEIAATALEATVENNRRLLLEVDRARAEVDRFARVAAHDLAAPLIGMKRLSEWIREEIADNPPGDSMQHVLTLEQRIERMSSLVSRIEDFASAGRTDAPNELVHCEALVRRVFDGLLGQRRFSLETSMLPPLDTARKKLRKVFEALLKNAMQHHDLAEGKIKVWSKHEGELLEFFVADDGPGVESRHHEKIFDLFVTLERRDVKEAAGAGLAIAKKIVQSEGGEIGVEPAEGRGTTIRFTWPRKRRADGSWEENTEVRQSIEFVTKKRQTLTGFE